MSPEPAGDILVVEDERPIRDMLRYNLVRAGFTVREAETATAAHERIAERLPDLLLVDWMLPDFSGLELTRMLRGAELTRKTSIIMLTARAQEADRVAGLDGGADDYITKPFSTRELLARIQTVLRRRTPADDTDEQLELGGLLLDRAAHRVCIGQKVVPLSPSEYRILSFLMAHAERAFSREQILERVWEFGTSVDARTVDVHIRRLRVVLEVFGRDYLVQTVRGVGYRFSEKAI